MVECWQAGTAKDARAQLQQLCYLLILLARWPVMLEQPLSSAVTAMGWATLAHVWFDMYL
jgi:hypothetical protein